MAKRKAAQDAEVAVKADRRKGPADRPHRPRQGQVDGGLRPRAARAWARQRVGVVQFIKGAWTTGERAAFERFGDAVTWRTMGEGFTWETQDRARDVAAASGRLA